MFSEADPNSACTDLSPAAASSGYSVARSFQGERSKNITSPAGERDPVARRAELQAIINREVIGKGSLIRRALELHVLPEVAADVRAAVRYLLAMEPDDGGSTDPLG